MEHLEDLGAKVNKYCQINEHMDIFSNRGTVIFSQFQTIKFVQMATLV